MKIVCKTYRKSYAFKERQVAEARALLVCCFCFFVFFGSTLFELNSPNEHHNDTQASTQITSGPPRCAPPSILFNWIRCDYVTAWLTFCLIFVYIDNSLFLFLLSFNFIGPDRDQKQPNKMNTACVCDISNWRSHKQLIILKCTNALNT